MEEGTSQMNQSESELMTCRPELIKFESEDSEGMGDATTTDKVNTLNTVVEDVPEKLERTLFVRNIPLTMTINAVKEIFKPFGEIESTRFLAVVPKQMSGGANAKYEYNVKATSIKGFIMFKTAEAANEALALNGAEVNIHNLLICKASSSNLGVAKDSLHRLRIDNAIAQYLNVDKNNSQTNISYSIFVGNLSLSVKDETLWNTFAQYGEVKSIKVIRKKNNVGRGIVFVQYEDEGAVQNQKVSQNDLKVQDKVIIVQQCGSQTINMPEPETPKRETETTTDKKDQSRKRKFVPKKKDQDESGIIKIFKKTMNERNPRLL